jgi:hypothetical protein
LSWFKRIFAENNDNLPHISEKNTFDERTRRLATISEEEQKAYKWLFEGYSEAWTTETLGLEKQDAKVLYDSIYNKLGVSGSREIICDYAPCESHAIELPGTGQGGDK